MCVCVRYRRVDMCLHEMCVCGWVVPAARPDTRPLNPAPGSTWLQPAAPPSLSCSQAEAPHRHAGNSARCRSVSHTGRSGSSLETRCTKNITSSGNITLMHCSVELLCVCVCVQMSTFAVGEHLHASTEHGLQHGVLLGEGLHGGVVQSSTHVQLHVLGAWTRTLERGCPGRRSRHSRAHSTLS